MTPGRRQSSGLGMRDAVVCAGQTPPPPPELVLATLAGAAAAAGGGVGALLDSACALGARAALVRGPRAAEPAAATPGALPAGTPAEPDDAQGDTTGDRLELPLGAPATSGGTLVLVLPPGLLVDRPDLRQAFEVIAGLVARELYPASRPRRTPSQGTPSTVADAPRQSARSAPELPQSARSAPELPAPDPVDHRIRHLREAATALGRVLEDAEIYREVGRQVGRALPVHELLIARPTTASGGFVVGFALRGGEERPSGGAIQEDDAAAGVIAEVARTGRPARASDGANAEAPALVGVPMLAGLQLVGVLLVRGAGFPDRADEELLRAFGAQAATALVNAALYADSQRERRQTEALADVARAVGSSLRLNEVLRLILRHASALLRVEGAYVALRSGEFLEIVAASGRAEVLRGLYLPENASLGGEVLRSSRALAVDDVDADGRIYRPVQRAVQAQRMLLAPLLTADGAIGALVVLNRPTPFDDGDARVLQRLADHVAVAIVNARLYEEVMESTREWTVAFDAIATGMLMLDERGRVQRCNASALAMLGAEHSRQVVGRPFAVVLLHEPSDEAAALLDTALGDRRVARGTLRSRARGRVFEIVASPHPHGGAVLTVDDVTTLHSITERYRMVVETARDAIVITDPSRHISFANPAAEQLFGRDGGIVGMAVGSLVPPEEREAVADYQRAAMAGAAQSYETVVIGAGGERRIVAVSTAPLRQLGDITGAIATLRDVSDERLLAAQLMQREKLAAIGQLVSGVAHELNNPLGGIMAFSQLLLAGSLDDDVREGAEVIHAEAARAAKIVGSLLAFARQQEPMRSAVDLNAVVRTVAQLRRYSLRSQQVELVLDLDPDLPRTWADEHQLHQVVLNLVTNAEQAMEQRPQPRRLTLATSHRDRRLEVRVSDTGAGMDSVQLDRVFNPFFTTKGVGEGTGLGLSIAHGIVREHSGELTAESEPGVGTTFRIVLPLASAPEDPADEGSHGADDDMGGLGAGAAGTVGAPGAGAPGAGAPGVVAPEAVAPEVGAPEAVPLAEGPARRRVLVVDEEASIRAAMCRYLRRAGYAVEAVAGGRPALAALAVSRFDAILLDLRMPDLAGDAVYDRLRATDPAQAARIVFVTGDLRSDRARDFLAGTGQPSVGKPFTFEELQQALELVMETPA